MKISLIVAMGINRVIGNKGKMPWHLPAELAYFKRVTMGYTVIMGRKTFETIGKALPGRRNIILTRNRSFLVQGCEVANSIEEVFHLLNTDKNEVFVIGGEDIFHQFICHASRLYITIIDQEFEGDSFFTDINLENWKLIYKEKHAKDSKNPYSFTCYVYEK